MALISMTGFARRDGTLGPLGWSWELKTVNGRGLDIRCRLPQGFENLEPQVRERAARALRRGNCQIGLQVRRDSSPGMLRINEKALDDVLVALEKIAGRVDTAKPSAEGVLALRGVLEVMDLEEAGPDQAVIAALLADLDEALGALCEARRLEGAKLEQAIAGQIDEIETLAGDARDCPARSPEAIRARLDEQIARLLGSGSTLDEQRLHQEAVLLAARVDIREELDRLFAHVAAARDLLALADDEAVGRRLDFLSQEFNREANTLCSKANHASLSAIGLNLKAVIDQMREQVQNIE